MFSGERTKGLTLIILAGLAFALLPHAIPAGAALLFTGLGQAGFAAMQSTLVYLAAPADMRPRIMGVLSVAIGTGPIGFVGLGLLADLIGAHWATAAFGAIGLAAMFFTRRLWLTI